MGVQAWPHCAACMARALNFAINLWVECNALVKMSLQTRGESSFCDCIVHLNPIAKTAIHLGGCSLFVLIGSKQGTPGNRRGNKAGQACAFWELTPGCETLDGG
jgi:hypothetical protein